MGFNGTDGATSMTDEGPAPLAWTRAGNGQIDTAQKKFGDSSLLLDGTGDWVARNDHANFQFGTGQFTIEGFVRFSSVATNWALLTHWGTSGTTTAFGFYGTAGNLTFSFRSTPGSTSRVVQYAWPTRAIDTWYHIAVDRDAAGTARLYLDGVMVASASLPQQIQTTVNDVHIGTMRWVAGYDLPGWIDELRVTKGVARYSGVDFTPPAAAYPRG